MTKIKFCGMRRKEDIETINALLPEYAGFVFAKQSKRRISFIEAQTLKELLDSRISAVGVFVNETPQIIAELLNKNIIDIAQLHGNESEDYIRNLKQMSSKPIIKVFNIENCVNAEKYEQCEADYIMFDSGSGGTGKPFEWSVIKKIKRDFFLAGGLSDSNVVSAIKECRPYAVDVSSGIETNSFKDRNKMEKFIRIVRNTDF